MAECNIYDLSIGNGKMWPQRPSIYIEFDVFLNPYHRQMVQNLYYRMLVGTGVHERHQNLSMNALQDIDFIPVNCMRQVVLQ